MVRSLHRLNAKFVASVEEHGSYPDGGGLSLVVKADRKAWQFRYTWQGKERYHGLGSARSVSLADARAKAANNRSLVAKGIDPIADQRGKKKKVPTFGELADDYIKTMQSQWSNLKHKAQWKTTFSVDVKSLRDIPADQIDTAHVLAVLKPIWQLKPETASRIRGRIEAVLAAATAKGFRVGANPAQWRHHLDRILPTQLSSNRGHHGAMKYGDVPALIKRLRENGSVSASAFEFLILNASRTSEVLNAKWPEIDLVNCIWIIPPDRMKARKEHRVPLTKRSIKILETMSAFGNESYIFPGRKKDRPLSNMALEVILRRFDLKKMDVTVHGFRSAFRDWAGDETDYPREVAETALAHNVGNAVERAYRRGDALEKRRGLMDEWADYVSSC